MALKSLSLALSVEVKKVKECQGIAIFTWPPRLPQHWPRLTLPGRSCTQLAAKRAEDTQPPRCSFHNSPPQSHHEKSPRQGQLEGTPRDPWAAHFFRLLRLWNSREDLQTTTDQRRQDYNVVPWTGSQNRKRTLTQKSVKQKWSPEYS